MFVEENIRKQSMRCDESSVFFCLESDFKGKDNQTETGEWDLRTDDGACEGGTKNNDKA